MQERTINQKANQQKLMVVTFVFLAMLLPFVSYTQISGTKSNPVVIGNFGAGNFSYTDTKNNGSAYGYIDSYTTTNSSPGNGQASNDIWYKLIIQGAATVTFSTCGSGVTDTYLHLLNSDYSFNYQNDDYGPSCSSAQASMNVTLAAGIYYLVAEGYGSSTGSITVSVSGTVQPPPAPADTRNFVKTWVATAPETDPNILMAKAIADVKYAAGYFDGLGRADQSIVKNGSQSSTGNADIATVFSYDDYGRQIKKYLPFVSATNDGLYKTNALSEQTAFYTGATSPVAGQGENYYYSRTDLESSPLNRVLKTYAPGNSWTGSGRGAEMKYWLNTTNDDVKIWTVTNTSNGWGAYAVTGSYGVGQLFKNVTVDEQGKQVVEFRDIDGNVILKKVQLTSSDQGTGSGYAGWLCTYYIYDDLNNLRCVIQPKGVESILSTWSLTDPTILTEQCFRYEYDERSRMIMKKVPGAGEVWMVYDTRNRLVMTQDANMRAAKQWMYSLYENDFNRTSATGLLTDPANYLNLAYHRGLASTSIAYPNLANYTTEELTRTFYDDYSKLSQYGNTLSSSYNAAYDTYFQAIGSSTLRYPQANIQSTKLLGQTTGSKIKVLGTTSTYLYSVNIYDDKLRMIQSLSSNITGGTDVLTSQYSWAGQPLITITKQEKAGSINAQTSIVVTQQTFDDLGRIAKVEKKVSNTLVNAGSMPTTFTTIAQNEYDAIGNLKKKKIAPYFNSNAGLETQAFDYNIRGWLLGMNRDFVSDAASANGRYFGFDLGYDKNGILGTYVPAYNGNISGTIWKSKGDLQKRKYDFSYDAANRLLRADFNQYSSGTGSAAVFDKSAGIDFSVKMGDGVDPAKAYDANGNIKQMQQWGLKITGSTQVDDLRYTYINGTNRIKNVTDLYNDPQTILGDFKTNTTHPQATAKAALTSSSAQSAFDGITDYGYDGNGNMNLDNNKGIGNISYNYLNLPSLINVAGKGTIGYVYDAGGNKLKKITTETAATVNYNSQNYSTSITTTTNYINGFIYETKQYGNSSLSALNYTDVLQFAVQEEGRIRFKPTVGTVLASFAYDYMLKDHLGNVRMLLTDETKQDKYPVASLEASKLSTEKLYYDIKDANVVDKSTATGITNYINDNGIGNSPVDATFSATNSAKLYKLNSSTAKTGLGITLKVMAGDKLDVFGKSYYFQNTSGNSTNSNIPLADLLAAFLGGATGAAATGVHGPVTAGAINLPVNLTGINNMIGQQNTQSNGNPLKPRAFINVVFFDEQFKSYDYRVSMVGTNSVVKDHYSELQNMLANKNGYVYIYCSNESPVNVFFDNLQVVHTRGPELEETHYYPFGLTMTEISSKALAFGGGENKYKFQKQELQSKEFSDGSGLELYDFGAREQDPQIGRWWTIDPKVEKYLSSSPYNFVDNNPISRIDPTGQDWFYYQAEGEKQKTWHWQKGHKATYVNEDGKNTTTKQGYKYLVTFAYDKGNTFAGAKRGTLTVYNQNKVLQQSTAFSGAGLLTGNFDQAAKGNYMMNLGQRSIMPKVNYNSDNDNANPPANTGMQKIENGTIVKHPDGSTDNVNSDYGNYRIRLNPTNGSRDRGLYLHGKDAWYNSRTHGCVCEKDQTVLQYMWDHKEITGNVPFTIDQPLDNPKE